MPDITGPEHGPEDHSEMPIPESNVPGLDAARKARIDKKLWDYVDHGIEPTPTAADAIAKGDLQDLAGPVPPIDPEREQRIRNRVFDPIDNHNDDEELASLLRSADGPSKLTPERAARMRQRVMDEVDAEDEGESQDSDIVDKPKPSGLRDKVWPPAEDALTAVEEIGSYDFGPGSPEEAFGSQQLRDFVNRAPDAPTETEPKPHPDEPNQPNQ